MRWNEALLDLVVPVGALQTAITGGGDTIPYHTTPHHTIPYHTIPYITLPYPTIPYHTKKTRKRSVVTTLGANLRKMSVPTTLGDIVIYPAIPYQHRYT